MEGGKRANIYKVEGRDYRCPLCYSEIHWSCHGKSGYAYCSKSANATRAFKRGEFHKLQFCEWQGYAERRPNGKVEIYYYP